MLKQNFPELLAHKHGRSRDTCRVHWIFHYDRCRFQAVTEESSRLPMAIVPGNRYRINTRELDVNASILACPRNYRRHGKSGTLVFHTIPRLDAMLSVEI